MSREVRSVVIVSGVAAIGIAAWAIGLASGAPGPRERDEPADRALAAAALLNRADLEPGWKASGSRVSGSVLSCSGALAPKLAGLTATASIGGPIFVLGRGNALAQSVRVFATAAQARTAWKRTVTRKLVICLHRQLEETSQMMSWVTVSEWHVLRLPKLVRPTFGLRVVAKTGPAKPETKIFYDLLVYGHGRMMTMLALTSTGRPPASSFEQRLAREIATRLRRT